MAVIDGCYRCRLVIKKASPITGFRAREESAGWNPGTAMERP
jgi:hypothetical protein